MSKMELTQDDLGGTDLKRMAPESWLCVDCDNNTAPGFPTREELERSLEAGNENLASFDWHDGCEVYTVRESVWAKAGVDKMGGCLCVGCLEKRLGRKLKPKDFLRGDPFNNPAMPATERLRRRRKD
jgi:hypothetical protein